MIAERLYLANDIAETQELHLIFRTNAGDGFTRKSLEKV